MVPTYNIVGWQSFNSLVIAELYSFKIYNNCSNIHIIISISPYLQMPISNWLANFLPWSGWSASHEKPIVPGIDQWPKATIKVMLSYFWLNMGRLTHICKLFHFAISWLNKNNFISLFMFGFQLIMLIWYHNLLPH